MAIVSGPSNTKVCSLPLESEVWDSGASCGLAQKTRRRIRSLFLLVTILSQSLFTLVGSHLVAFSFFSAGHNVKIIMLYE